MKHEPLVTVIVVSWNNRDLLDTCFESVYAQTYKNWELVLVDNGSKDGSEEHTRKHHPNVKVIQTGYNAGFVVANNTATTEAFENPDCRYIMLLNSDATIREDWLEIMVKFAEANPNAACMQAPTVDYYDHDIYDSCGITMSQGALATQIGYREKNLDLKTMKVFGVNAAAALYSRTFLEAQPFGHDYSDPDLFMYLDDIDVSARAIIMGYDNWLVTGTVGYHMGSASSGKLPGFSMYMTYRNNWLVLAKNFPVRIIWRTIPGMMRAEFARLKAFTREGTFVLVRKIISGRLHSLPRLPGFIRKRRALKPYWKISEQALWELMAIPKIPRLEPEARPFGSESVTVLVLSRNHVETLAACLTALRAQSYPNFRILVIDNASTDGSGRLLGEQFKDVRFTQLTENLGMANGFNFGITQALREDPPDYLAMVHGDTLVEADWLSDMVEAIRHKADAFMMGSKVKRAEGVFQGYDYQPGQLPTFSKSGREAREVVAASHEACMVRVEFIGPVGFMDGEFFDGFEETDWCLRARLQGYTTHMTNRAVARIDTPRPDPLEPQRWYQHHKNAYYIYVKNLPFKLFWKYFGAAAAAFGDECGRAMRQGLVGAMAKTIVKCIVKTPRMLLYRHRVNVRRRERSASMEQWLHEVSPR